MAESLDRAMAHTSADDQYESTPPGAGYEHTDVSIWLIAKFGLWLVVAAVIIHVGVAVLFGMFVERRTERGEPRYPLAAAAGQRLPPEPRLQRFPRQDIMNYRLGEQAALTEYRWLDKDAGLVQIPITDAMRLTLERGLPHRQAGTAAPVDPRLMPADSSSGRTLEQRRQ